MQLGSELHRTTEPAAVGAFVSALLSAPVRPDRGDLSPRAEGFVGLVLDDGTVLARVYHARDGVLAPGLALPPAARRVAERLLAP